MESIKSIRINRFLSLSGVCSRRKADLLIKEGKIKVNGRVIREVGIKVNPLEDVITVNGKVVNLQNKVYYILNKPPGYLTTMGEDIKGRRTVRELIKSIPERVYPVGRLDYNSEGLIILTNDGEMAHRILHPSFHLNKVYHVVVKGEVSPSLLNKMRKGVMLDDGFIKPDALKIIKREPDRTYMEMVVHEGRKRIVRRFFKKFNREVVRLIRVQIGNIRLGDLKKGRFRRLTDQEVEGLKSLLGF